MGGSPLFLFVFPILSYPVLPYPFLPHPFETLDSLDSLDPVAHIVSYRATLS